MPALPDDLRRTTWRALLGVQAGASGW